MSYEYAEHLEGLYVEVSKVGGGTLGKSYDGDWDVCVSFGEQSSRHDTILCDVLHTGTPKTHMEAARIALDFAEETEEFGP